jgi:hypothetical protein
MNDTYKLDAAFVVLAIFLIGLMTFSIWMHSPDGNSTITGVFQNLSVDNMRITLVFQNGTVTYFQPKDAVQQVPFIVGHTYQCSFIHYRVEELSRLQSVVELSP